MTSDDSDAVTETETANYELFITGTGQVVRVHPVASCDAPCPIHAPTAHRMRDYPTHYRADRGIMERVCPHGVGHPDPDDIRIRTGGDPGVHGCDGCCWTTARDATSTLPPEAAS